MVSLAPHILRGVKFRCISRKEFRMDPGMFKKPFFDFSAPVDSSTVPEKNNRPSKVPRKSFKKGAYIQARKIVAATADIKGDVPVGWRYRKCADGGNPVLFIEMAEERRLSLRCPCAGNMRNKQKAAFVKEYEMGAKPFDLFLYAAIDTASNGRFPLRSFAAHDALASGSSSPFLQGSSRHDWDDSICQTVSLSVRRCVAMSKGPCGNRRSKGPLKETLPVFSSGYWRVSPGVQEWASAEEPLSPSFDRIGAIDKQSSWMPPANARLKREIAFPVSRVGSPDGGAVLAVEVFLVVS